MIIKAYDHYTGFYEREAIFNTFPNHLYPLIRQRKFFYNTLQSLDIHLWFNPFVENEIYFINQCFGLFSGLPFLRSLVFKFTAGMTDTEAEKLSFERCFLFIAP